MGAGIPAEGSLADAVEHHLRPRPGKDVVSCRGGTAYD